MLRFTGVVLLLTVVVLPAHADWKKSDQQQIKSIINGLKQRGMGSDPAVKAADEATKNAKPSPSQPEVCTGGIPGDAVWGEFVPPKRKEDEGEVLIDLAKIDKEYAPSSGAVMAYAGALQKASTLVEEFHHADQDQKLQGLRKRMCMPDKPQAYYVTPLPTPPTAPTPETGAARAKSAVLYELLKLAANAENAHGEVDAKYHKLCNFDKIAPPQPAGMTPAVYVQIYNLLLCAAFKDVCDNIKTFNAAKKAFNDTKAAYDAVNPTKPNGCPVAYTNSAGKPASVTIDPATLGTDVNGLSIKSFNDGKTAKKTARTKSD